MSREQVPGARARVSDALLGHAWQDRPEDGNDPCMHYGIYAADLRVLLEATAPADEDTAAAILAGLIETVRVMKDNAYGQARTADSDAYGLTLNLLLRAAERLPSAADAYTNPVDKIEQQAREV